MHEQWVSAALERSGLSGAELARRISKRLGRSIDRAAVNKMLKARRGVSADEMMAIAEETGQPIPGFASVPLLSWVSAGSLVDTSTQTPAENVPFLMVGGLGDGDYFALRVEGDSMDRISPEGSVIVIDRLDRELVAGKPYVFWSTSGATYKLWRPRPPRLDPHSTNPRHQPIFMDPEDDPIVLGRVKRSVLDL